MKKNKNINRKLKKEMKKFSKNNPDVVDVILGKKEMTNDIMKKMHMQTIKLMKIEKPDLKMKDIYEI